ncbi:hypothetical protein BS50DRAFT_621961 [Corynespora cassiicola Philippines]|uniref:Uncharacterized protein n=1 Tax=Corynespora cassiicola Philippines TaxID=1448308 RepID=A0A2T2NLW3_CORCC|nr:hypothetical protein BS50DRAFT_621961 [Corynespora cassiicola Philippines]
MDTPRSRKRPATPARERSAEPNTADSQPGQFPSNVQVALAMAVVKSKPHDMTVTGKHQSPSERDQTTYLDMVAFLQEQVKSLQQRNQELELRNAKLEQSNIILTGQPIFDEPKLSANPPKRKKGSAATRQGAHDTKSRSYSPDSNSAADATLEDEFSCFEQLEEGGAILSYNVFAIHKLWKQQQSDYDDVCFHLVQATSALGTVICYIGKNHDEFMSKALSTTRTLANDNSLFAQAIRSSARVFMVILFGLQKLQTRKVPWQLSRRIIFETVNMFKLGLKAVAEAAHEFAGPPGVTVRTGKRTSIPKECAASMKIARLLITFLASLDKNDTDHQEIFEGFVYLLLERVGEQLYYFTFGHFRQDTLEKEIAAGDEKDGSTNRRDMALHYEAKALVVILERAMGLAPNHMNPASKGQRTSARLARTLSLKNLPTTSRSQLTQQARDRLQRTLIKCMFGDEDGDEFLEVLRMPVRLAAAPKTASIGNEHVGEWFRTQVFKLCGWELLGREGGW